MTTKTKGIRLTFTEEEAMALFIECQCCAIGRHAEPYQSAKEKLHKALDKQEAFSK